MPDNENNIGGRVELDTTDFKSGIAELNRQIRVIDSGFKAAAAGMTDWGKSAEGLQGRINSLSQVTELQKKKIAGLAQEYERIAAEKGKDSKAAQDLQIRINKETEALNKNQLELKQTSDALSNYGKKSDEASDKTSKFTTNLRSIGGGVAKAAVVGIAAVGTAAAAAATGAFKLAEKASNLSEAQNVVQQTFKESSQSVIDWTKSVQASAGISQTNATKFVGSMGAMLKSSGLSEKASAGMAESLVQLTGDMSSFYNLGHDEMWEKIRSGISGETEPLKQLGINMSVANMEAFALSQGITKSWNSMSQAEQTTLRYQYLMKATADAQGDFGRTLETSFPNQLRVAQMQMESMATSIGQQFLPSFLDIFKAINTGFSSGDWSKVGESVSKGLSDILTKVTSNLPNLITVGTSVINGIVNSIVQAIPVILPSLAGAAVQIVNALATMLKDNGPLLITASVDAITTLINGLVATAPTLVEAAIAIILALVTAILANLPQLITAAIQIIVAIATGLLNNMDKIIAAIPQIIAALVAAVIQNLPVLVVAAIQIALAILAGIIKSIPQILTAVPRIFSELGKAIGNIDWGSIGKSMIDGIISGIRNAGSSLITSILNVAKNAVQAVKNFFGIQSPSTLMRDQIGLQLGAGMAEGISDSAKKVNAAMAKLNTNIKSSVDVSGVASIPGQGTSQVIVNVPVNLDGQIITKSTSRIQYSKNSSKARSLGVIPV